MIKKLTKYFLVLAMFAFLAACAQLGQQEANNIEGKNAITYIDHEKLANYYDDQAKEMAIKAKEKKQILTQYENHSNTYGRRGLDIAHAQTNIRYFEQAANDALKKADIHQKIAADLRKRESSANAERPEQKNQQRIKTRIIQVPATIFKFFA